MADWVNIADIDGLTFTQTDGTGAPLSSDLSLSGGVFSGTITDASYLINVTGGPNVAPGYSLRETLTYTYSSDATVWIALVGSAADSYTTATGDPSLSGSIVIDRAISVEPAVAGFTADSGPTIVMSLVVEIDADHVTGTTPPTEPPADVIYGLPLLRNSVRSVDPGQGGQQEIPPSHHCVVAEPPPPPSGGGNPPDPGGGAGAGGDGGGYPVCNYIVIPGGVLCYTYYISTPDGTVAQTLCTNYPPHAIPTNAPCR